MVVVGSRNCVFHRLKTGDAITEKNISPGKGILRTSGLLKPEKLAIA
jgi:hypothetical protein